MVWLWTSMTPRTRPPTIAPGIEPSPPIIMAISPFNVAHIPSMAVTCWLADSTRKPATPPIAEASAKAFSIVRWTSIPERLAAMLFSMIARSPRPNRLR